MGFEHAGGRPAESHLPRARRSSSLPAGRRRGDGSSAPTTPRKVRSMKVRDTEDFDVDRAACSSSAPIGSCVRR
jgi:hypothetical protein